MRFSFRYFWHSVLSPYQTEEKEWREVRCEGIAPSPRCESVTCAYRWRGHNGLLVFGGSQEGLIYKSDVHFFNVGNSSSSFFSPSLSDLRRWEKIEILGEPPEDRIGSSGCIVEHKLYGKDTPF